MDFRNKIFVIIIAVAIMAGLFIRSPLSVLPFIYIVFGGIFSFIYLLIIKNSCQVLVDTGAKKEYERMSSENYKISIINKGILVFPLIKFTIVVEDDLENLFNKNKYEFTLNSRETKELDIDITFPHIGQYRVRICELEILGLFNLLSLKFDPEWSEDIFISPKLYKLEEYKLETLRAILPVDFPTAHKIDGEIYDDIREYVAGDPIKNIHWKLSAHANEYMTRILKIDAVSGASIFLDFNNREKLSIDDMAHINDGIVEIGYSLGHYILDEERGLSFVYSDKNEPKSISPKDLLDLEECIYNLPKFSSEEYSKIEDVILNYGSSYKSLDNIIVISHNISEELLSILLEIRNTGKEVLYCIVGTRGLGQENRDLLKMSRLDYMLVDSAEDFTENLRGVENV